MARPRLLDMASAVLAVCALVVTVLVVKREFFTHAPSSRALTPTVQRDWRLYTSSGHVLGSATATVTIVEFADFECPYCKRFHDFADSLWRLGVDFKVVYRHYPVTGHRFALPAARAAECAAAQGRFAAMHAALYSHPDSFGIAPWEWFAERAGVRDSAEFRNCNRSTTGLASLALDTIAANRLGISGTPLLLIGETRLNGLPSFDALRSHIERARK